MKEFIEKILESHFNKDSINIFEKSPLLQYLDFKMSAIYGSVKSRRSLGNIYAFMQFYIFM